MCIYHRLGCLSTPEAGCSLCAVALRVFLRELELLSVVIVILTCPRASPWKKCCPKAIVSGRVRLRCVYPAALAVFLELLNEPPAGIAKANASCLLRLTT